MPDSFPRQLHRPDGSTCLVGTDEAKAEKLAEGWHIFPGDGSPPASYYDDHPDARPIVDVTPDGGVVLTPVDPAPIADDVPADPPRKRWRFRTGA